jgi:hypothetical protein
MEMSPTSKNALKIGGALILIALFLVCGPLRGRLGSGGKNVEEAPSVATGPPLEPVEVDTTDALEAVAAGALIGTSAPESELVAPLEGVKMEDELPVLPIVAAAATGAAAGAAVVADSGTGSGGPVLPPVSAGVPPTNVAAVDPAVAAASAFDDSMASRDGSGNAGPAADRFPPPVAAEGDSLLALSTEPFGMDSGSLLQPCDSPGTGCQNLRGGGGGGGGGSVTPFGSGSPRGPR